MTSTLDDRRPIDRLLDRYGEHHENRTNVLIHAAAVPMIVWSVLALLSSLPFPEAVRIVPGLDWGLIAAAAAILYYVSLSARLAAAMAASAAVYLWLVRLYPADAPLDLPLFALAVFAGASVLQAIGHRIEGKRPSFFDDVRFLLIGPVWLMAVLFRAFRLSY